MARTERCMRCKRRYRQQPDWNQVYVRGRVQGLICPDCQTPDENAEAERNLEVFPPSSRQSVSLARVVGTATFARWNRVAVAREWLSFTDEAIVGLDPDGQHVLLEGGKFEGDEFSILAVAIVNIEVIDAEKAIHSPRDGDDWRVVEIGHQEDRAPGRGFLQVEAVEWMGAEEVVIQDGGEWQRKAAEEADAYLRRLIDQGGES